MNCNYPHLDYELVRIPCHHYPFYACHPAYDKWNVTQYSTQKTMMIAPKYATINEEAFITFDGDMTYIKSIKINNVEIPKNDWKQQMPVMIYDNTYIEVEILKDNEQQDGDVSIFKHNIYAVPKNVNPDDCNCCNECESHCHHDHHCHHNHCECEHFGYPNHHHHIPYEHQCNPEFLHGLPPHQWLQANPLRYGLFLGYPHLPMYPNIHFHGIPHTPRYVDLQNEMFYNNTYNWQ